MSIKGEKRKRPADSDPESDCESVGCNFDSPVGKTLDTMCSLNNIDWPVWKDLILFKELLKARTKARDSEYAKLSTYSWKTSDVWFTLTYCINEELRLRNLSNPNPDPNPNPSHIRIDVEQVKTRVRQYNNNFSSFLQGNGRIVDSDLSHLVYQVFMAKKFDIGPPTVPPSRKRCKAFDVGPLEAPPNENSREPNSSSLVTHVGEGNSSHGNISLDNHVVVSSCNNFWNVMNKFRSEGLLTSEEAYRVSDIITKKKCRLITFLQMSEEDKVGYLKSIMSNKP